MEQKLLIFFKDNGLDSTQGFMFISQFVPISAACGDVKLEDFEELLNTMLEIYILSKKITGKQLLPEGESFLTPNS